MSGQPLRILKTFNILHPSSGFAPSIDNTGFESKRSLRSAIGKIERNHRTMKNVVKLGNDYHPNELRRELGQLVEYYNN